MLDLLAICAHPDDLEVCAGGIFIKAKQAGLTTGLIILTDGAASGKAQAQARREEAIEGARLLGLDFFRQLDFPDAALECNQQSIQAVIPHLREAAPRYIFTLHPEDYHPDHVATSRITQAAAFCAGLPQYATDGSRWHYRNIFFFAADLRTNKTRPDVLFDISDVLEQKLAACRAHKSQGVADYALMLGQAMGTSIFKPQAEGLYLRQALEIDNVKSLFL